MHTTPFQARTGVVARDLFMNLWGMSCTVPQGTRVKLIVGADGVKGDVWAIADVAVLIALTGNDHDPKYRYAWVPADAVTPTEAAS